jgi:hypothetical protein
MAAAASGFVPASELGPSPSREAELEDLCSRQAEQIERLQDLATEPQQPTRQPQGAIIRPEEKQALAQLLSDLAKRVEDLEKLTARQARRIEDLENQVRENGQEVYDVHEMAKGIIGDACKRITAMEERDKPQKTDVTLGHINILASELLTRAKAGQRGVTYAEAAKILKLDKSRVCQLRGLIASDSRFNIDWHPNRKNMKVICLKKYKTKEIVELNVQ